MWRHLTQVAGKARQKHQEAVEASKHALKASLYWKGAIGRAHSNLTKSALKQVHQGHRETKKGLVQMGHGRQATEKHQKHERQLMGNYHGQLNMLKAFIRQTDLQHRCSIAVLCLAVPVIVPDIAMQHCTVLPAIMLVMDASHPFGLTT